MLDMVLNFLREQGILIILGLLVAGGIFGQIMASVRFRKLRRGIQSLAALQTPVKKETPAVAKRTGRVRGGQAVLPAEEGEEEVPSRSRRSAEAVAGAESGNALQETRNAEAVTAQGDQEVDSQLLYLKQSLERIAAGRDQKLEEETRPHRKLTPAEEQIIVDILKEYLS